MDNKLTDLLRILFEKIPLLRLLFSLMITLGFALVPRINFLYFIFPLDNHVDVAILVFAVLVFFFSIEAIIRICKWSYGFLKKRKDRKHSLQILEDKVKNSRKTYQKVLLGLIKNENKPQRYEEHQVSPGDGGFCFLEYIPGSGEHYAGGYSYEYRIDHQHINRYRSFIKLKRYCSI